jgi:membrane fusion protein (multidrug efflux system)
MWKFKKSIAVFIVCMTSFSFFVFFYKKNISAELAFVDVNLLEVRAEQDGLISAVNVKKGDLVLGDKALMTMEKKQLQLKILNQDLELENLLLTKQSLKTQLQSYENELEIYHQQKILADQKFKLKSQNAERLEKLERYAQESKLTSELYIYEKIDEQFNLYNLAFDEKKSELRKSLISIELKNLDISIKKTEVERQLTAFQISKLDIHVSKVGTIGEVFVQPGEYVSKGDLLAVVVPTDDIHIAAYFDEKYLPKLSIGMSVSCQIISFPHSNFNCTIADIGNVGGAKRSNTPLSLTSGYIVQTMQRVPVIVNIEGGEKAKLVIGLSTKITFKDSF